MAQMPLCKISRMNGILQPMFEDCNLDLFAHNPDKYIQVYPNGNPMNAN